MRKALILLVFVCVALAGAGAAQATLIQEDFEGLSVGPGVPPGWFQGYKGPGTTWETIRVDGNTVLKGAAGAVGPPEWQADAISGPDSPTGWFVENSEMQVSFNILSGDGGGIGIGQFDGISYVGNSYYVWVEVPESRIALHEAKTTWGEPILEQVVFPAGAITYGAWYDLRMVSNGTTFQVWFRPHSAESWQDTQRIMEVPQDLLHSGHKAYVDGLAGLWVSDDDGGPAGPSTMLFDDFRLEALPFPAAEDLSDDFENAALSLANWSQHWCVLDFPAVGGSQAARVSAGYGHPAGGIGLRQARQYYTHGFILRTSLCLDSSFDGGIAWGWEGTATTDTDFFISPWRIPGQVGLEMVEELNDSGGSHHTVLATYAEPEQAGVEWYTIEVAADYNFYRVWWWKRGDPKPASPVIVIPQDLAHPGYRLVNLGAVALWQNPYHVACFDDFFFHGTPAPSFNTPEGSNVAVQPDPNLDMTFGTVSEGGTTSVETSTTAPGGGPGGLAFQGLYYDIDTTCVYSGPITISLTYDDSGMTPEQEANLRLMHWVTANQTWVDITVLPVDTVNNVITGVTDSLSVFAIAALPVFQGFLQPINMPPAAMSVFKQKSTIPVKFKLLDAATGAPVADAVATIWGEKVAQGVPSGVNEPIYSTQPDGGNTFRYDAAAGQYIYNLSTKSLTSGTIYRIHANIMGGLTDMWVDVAVK